MIPCPCCKRPLPEGFRISAEAARAIVELIECGPKEHRILMSLARHFGSGIRRDQLVEMVYAGDPDGGPENAFGSVGVIVHRLRKKIAPFGLEIVGASHYGSRLQWKETST